MPVMKLLRKRNEGSNPTPNSYKLNNPVDSFTQEVNGICCRHYTALMKEKGTNDRKTSSVHGLKATAKASVLPRTVCKIFTELREERAKMFLTELERVCRHLELQCPHRVTCYVEHLI